METVVVALLVGAFGGLVGAALGPFLGHILNGWQRKDIRRERRHGDIRVMLEKWTGEVRELAASEVQVKAAIEAGKTASEAHTEHLHRMLPIYKQGILWQPERIDDLPLRQLAEQYGEASRSYRSWFKSLSASPFPEWEAEAERRYDIARLLATKVVKRLDDLDW